jgi:Family of unknown function (DUF5689)
MSFTQIKYTLTALIFSVLFVSCDKMPIGPTGPDPLGPGDYMSFVDIRALYPSTGGDYVFPTGTKRIRGIVISNSINEASSVYRLQDESGAGIYLFTLNNSVVYQMGDVLEINPNGGKFTLYNGDLEMMGVPMSNITKVGGTISITPRVATIAEINANKNIWASTLVKINNVTSITQSGSNPTGITYTIADATGTLSMFVRTASGITVNTSGTSVTGYVSIYLISTQIGIRTAGDIQ